MTSEIKEEYYQSIRTTLLVPFYLKEKIGDQFLNNGFEIDDILNSYFKEKIKSSSFLKICTTTEDGLKIALVKLLLKKLEFGEERGSARKIKIFDNSSLNDKKYLSSVESFYSTIDTLDYRDIGFIEKFIADNLGSFKFRYSEVDSENNNPTSIDFLISDIKLIFNRSATCKGIGYGFISIIINWKSNEDILETSKLIAKSQNLLRFYISGDKRGRGKFNCILDDNSLLNSKRIISSCQDFFNFKLQNKKRANLHLKKEDHELNDLVCNENTIEKIIGKISENNTESKNDESKNDFNAIKLLMDKSVNHAEKISTSFTFKDIVDEILNIFIDINHPDNTEKGYKKYLDFTVSEENSSSVKPSYLHLSKLQNNNLNKEFDNLPFDILRLPPKKSTSINNDEISLRPITVDERIRFYLQSEGAFIVEGNEMNFKEYSNKYFLSFLFAINQRFLFQYFQQKITELNLVNSNYYDPRELRRLNANMIKAEFSQVFSSISNYHEIDLFYEKFREVLNIKELKEEYLASINGLERIVSIVEKENQERKEINKNQILGFFGILIGVGEVYSGLTQTVIEDMVSDNQLKNIINICVYSVIIILLVLSFYRLVKKEK
jgi:hypothetical protein